MFNQQRHKSPFIVFEGIDCCGKSTQLRLLAERMKNLGINHTCCHDSRSISFSREMRLIIQSGDFDVCTDAEFYLVMAARAQLDYEVIRPAIERNDVVLCDRYYPSTLAYQGAGNGVSLAQDEAVVIGNSIEPDIVVYVDITVEEMRSRASNRPEMRDRIERRDDAYFTWVRNAYHSLATDRPEWIFINGEQPPGVVADEIACKMKEMGLLELA